MSEKLSEETKKLREMTGLKVGDEVYATVVHVARSGMYRCMKLFVVKNNRIWDITTPDLCNAIEKYDKNHGCLGISGCGMDMTFEAVYRLGRILFPNGFTEKQAQYESKQRVKVYTWLPEGEEPNWEGHTDVSKERLKELDDKNAMEGRLERLALDEDGYGYAVIAGQVGKVTLGDLFVGYGPGKRDGGYALKKVSL